MPDCDARVTAKDLFYGSVTIGERGQIVIPAEARKHYSLSPGDKLLVFRHPQAHGMVLARLDDVETLLGELRHWVEVVSQLREEGAAPLPRAERRPQKKGGKRG